MQNFQDAESLVRKESFIPRGNFAKKLPGNFCTQMASISCASSMSAAYIRRHIYKQVVSSGAIYTRSAHAIRNLESYSKIF